MKKMFMLFALLIAAQFGFSQSLEEITDMIVKKDYVNAKAAIDKYLADEKNAGKSDAWYFKGRTYNALSYDKATPETELYNLKNAAFEALKKSQQLDPKDTRLKLEAYTSYLDLYFGLYDLGANLFNAKNYDGAYNSFKKALDIKDYILSKQYIYPQATLHPLDTSLVLNTAIAATQAKKTDEAVGYYKKLVDANITGDNYKEVYEFLADYYNNKQDAAALTDIVSKGKKYYPTSTYWDELELASVSKKGDQSALFSKYDEMLSKNPKNFYVAYNYAVELHNKINKAADPASENAAKDKLYNVLKIAIASDTGIDATILMANHLYNMFVEYSNGATMVKGTKAEDVKKKSDMKAMANKKMDECISYSEQAVKYFEPKVSTLKPSQKANYKIILDYLSELYKIKGDSKKSADYEKKRVSVI
ncbi:MAG: hypothetical protein ABIO04_10505 [Ferruginibacter sp.]